MAPWSRIEQEAPELATRARGYLDAFVHKTMATLMRDGAPRISGSEVIWAEGELWFGSMWRSLKAQDLLRDPRFSLHSGSSDPPEWPGDATLSGRAVECDDADIVRVVGDGKPPGPMHLFRADIARLSVVHLNEARDGIVLETWREGRGLSRRERK